MKRTITTLPVTVVLSGTDVTKLSGVAEMLQVVVPINKITLLKQSAVGVEPKVFLYKIEAADGRLWKQVMTFDNPGNPLMTFDVIDAWRLSEFSQQRNVRNAMVAFVAAYPDLEKLTYDFI